MIPTNNCRALNKQACVLACLFAYAWIGLCFGLASGQSQYGQNTPAPISRNEPTLIRPQGYSVDSSTTLQNNATQVIVQPDGQRVFQQLPAGQSQSNNTLNNTPNSNLAASGVQPASWSAPAISSERIVKSSGKTPIELKPRSKDKSNTVDKPSSTWAAALSMFFSLMIVLSLFLLIAWLFRKSQPTSFVKLPNSVVQVMGRTAMAPRQQVYVVRFGNKLLLVSHQPGQTQTLCEITDPDEIQRLSGLCEANHPSSISHSFRDVLKQVASGKPEPSRRAAIR